MQVLARRTATSADPCATLPIEAAPFKLGSLRAD
jgi:hypothetical protein